MRCSFCNNEIEKGTGLLYVKKDGSVLSFCSQKCKRNSLKLGREGRLLKWTSKALIVKTEKEEKKEEKSAFAAEVAKKLAETRAAKKQEKKKGG